MVCDQIGVGSEVTDQTTQVTVWDQDRHKTTQVTVVDHVVTHHTRGHRPAQGTSDGERTGGDKGAQGRSDGTRTRGRA